MQYNTVINGDCDRIMPEMIEEGIKADLILTDPPYNLNKDFGNDSDKLELSDFLKVTKSRVNLCKQLLEPNGSLLWFGIHHYIGFIQTIMYEAGLYYRRMNIWYYENGFSRTSKAPLAQALCPTLANAPRKPILTDPRSGIRHKEGEKCDE